MTTSGLYPNILYCFSLEIPPTTAPITNYLLVVTLINFKCFSIYKANSLVGVTIKALKYYTKLINKP